MNKKFSVFQFIQPYGASMDRYSLSMVIHYTALVGFAGHLLFIGLFIWLGVAPMAIVNVASCLVFLGCFYLNRRGVTHLALLLGVAEVVLHAVLAVIFVGWQSSFHYYILSLTPLIYYSQIWRDSFKLGLTLALASIYVALFLFTLNQVPLHPVQPLEAQVVGIVNICTLFVVFSALAALYRAAANHAEDGLTRANLKLEQLAHTDPLTHLLNRRKMEQEIRAAVHAYERYGQPFSVILGDIDNFKQVNDRYSHQGGDQVLIGVAERMQGCLRDLDRIARWGGEEYLILLPGISAPNAEIVANRIRECIASAQFTLSGEPVQVTITFGCAHYMGGSSTETIHQADLAMFAGKKAGKNRVMVYQAESMGRVSAK